MPPPIVFVNRYFYPDHSATSQFTSSLAFELVRQGYPVHVITSRQAYEDPKQRLVKREEVHGVHVHRIWTSRFGRTQVGGLMLDYLTFYVSSIWRLWRILRRGWVVVARTDPPLISVVGWLIAWVRGARQINWLADLFPEIATELRLPGGNGRVSALLRWLRNHSLKTARVNIVLGDTMEEHIRAEGISGDRICVIRDWVDKNHVRPMAKFDNRLALEWGLLDRFVVGYSGNMGRAHEFDTVIDAMTGLRERDNLRFLFIGGGVRKHELTDAVESRGLGNVVFQPYQPWQRLGESLTVPDVHLITLQPQMEGLIVPSKFYSAAAAGRPTLYVGDSKGEIARLLSKHSCGFTIEPGDVRGLVQTIERLSSDPVLYRKMASNARATFEEHFEQSISVAAWCRVLEGVCG